jgi:hypothetical protein
VARREERAEEKEGRAETTLKQRSGGETEERKVSVLDMTTIYVGLEPDSEKSLFVLISTSFVSQTKVQILHCMKY